MLHNHSTWSDGRLSLGAVARVGERLGASAVLMSEHDFDFNPLKWDAYVAACREASTAKCAIIPGIEYSSPDEDLHVVTMGTPRFHGARQDLVTTLTAIRRDGGAGILAHPRRRDALSKVSDRLLEVVDGIEVWNRKTDGLRPVNAYFQFARDRGLAPIAAMDLHTWRQIFPMWNEISEGSEPLSGGVVAAALRKREISPACILGRVEPGLARRFSLALCALTAAEQLRRLLRDARTAISRN